MNRRRFLDLVIAAPLVPLIPGAPAVIAAETAGPWGLPDVPYRSAREALAQSLHRSPEVIDITLSGGELFTIDELRNVLIPSIQAAIGLSAGCVKVIE